MGAFMDSAVTWGELIFVVCCGLFGYVVQAFIRRK